MSILKTKNYQLKTKKRPKVFFATDHAGFEMKEEVLKFVRDELGHQVEDCGAYELDSTDDYPDFMHCAAQAVSAAPNNTMAIIFGGSGQGEAMVANRYEGVRATVYYGEPILVDSLECLVDSDDNPNTVSTINSKLQGELQSKMNEERSITTILNLKRSRRCPGVKTKNLAQSIITLSREHNNANVLSIGARFVTSEEAKEAVKLWLETQYLTVDRHERRIQKIDIL